MLIIINSLFWYFFGRVFTVGYYSPWFFPENLNRKLWPVPTLSIPSERSFSKSLAHQNSSYRADSSSFQMNVHSYYPILVQTVGFVEKPGSLHRGMAVKTGTVKSGRVQPTTTTYVRPIVVAIELIALCVLIMIKNRCIIILYSCCVCSWAYFPLSSLY